MKPTDVELISISSQDNQEPTVALIAKEGLVLEEISDSPTGQNQPLPLLLDQSLLAAEVKLGSSTSLYREPPEAMTPVVLTDPLWIFLNKLDITPQDLQRLDISEEWLRPLFQQEISRTASFKWSRFEQFLDKILHGLLLSNDDVDSQDKKACLSARVWPQEQSILLHRRWGLRKAYATSKLVSGIQFGVLEFVRLFVLSMLLYRLGSWASSGIRDFSAFEAIFTSNNQKGIDSLTGLMAKLKPSILKFILVSPVILGALQSAWEFVITPEDTQDQIVQRVIRLAQYATSQSSLWADIIRENIPILATFTGVDEQIEQLTRSLNWNGQLTPESYRNAFSMICQIAEQGRKFPQWAAIGGLAKLQGIGLKDFPKLKVAGYSKDILLQRLFIKEGAFKALTALAQKHPEESFLKTAPRRIVASFWLWWLGQSTSWLKQRIPFFTFKTGLFILEIYFFYTIANSLVKAIECPDKPGFLLGDGYLPWASDYTAACFIQRLATFTQEFDFQTTQQLVIEIKNYHLTDFKNIELYYSFISASDAYTIIQAILAQGAPLQSVDVSQNALVSLPSNFLAGLSQLQYLNLSDTGLASFPDKFFVNSPQLRYLDLSWNALSNITPATFYSLSQLQTLKLAGNFFDNLPTGAFGNIEQLQILDVSNCQIGNLSGYWRGLNQLQVLILSNNPLKNLQQGDFSEVSQLQDLDLSSTQLNTVSSGAFKGLSQLHALSLAGNFLTSLPPNSFADASQLQSLDLSGNRFNTSTFTNLLLSLPATLTSLNISNNAILNFSSNLSSLWPPALRMLAIGGNPVVPSTLSQEWVSHFPPQLNSFSLSSSYTIINFSSNAFTGFWQLQSLNLSNNFLLGWPSSTLSGLSQLQDLDVSENEMTALSSLAFANLPQLRSLYLAGNPITTISSDAFLGTNQLQNLDLSATLISNLSPNTFIVLTYLQSLSITNNPFLLQLPPGLFSAQTQLQFLDLSFNNLTGLPPRLFVTLSQLQLLNISSNQISNIPSGGFTGLSKLQTIDLSFNNEGNIELINNISVNFPFQVTQFVDSVTSRNGTYSNQSTLNLFVNILPCFTQIKYMVLKGERVGEVNFLGFSYVINLINTVTQRLLKNACESQLCHANLPPQQLCRPSTILDSQTATPAAYSDRFLTFAEKNKDETMPRSSVQDLAHFDGGADIYFTHTSLISNFSSPITAIGNPATQGNFTDSHSKPIIVGGTVLSVVALSILLYKNPTWVKAIVDTSYRMAQTCWRTTTATASYFIQTSWRSTLWAGRSYSRLETICTPTISPKQMT